MWGHIVVRPLYDLSQEEIRLLLSESIAQGHRFIDRLVKEYADGTNRFALPDEALYGVYCDEQLVAIGGLNRDPFLADDDVGRVRHVYVLSGFRRQGVGTRLLHQVIDDARQHFRLLTLRTFSEDAVRFYVVLGFQPTSEIPNATHVLSLDVKTDVAEL